MSATEKNVELLRKLKALAEQGFGGERENAQQLLSRLMKKYGVVDADLSDESVEEHAFTYSTPQEKTILLQLFYKIATGREHYRYTYGEGARTKIYCVCTKAEAVQINVEYDFYRALWKEELSFFLSAFIQKHRIFDTKPGHKTAEISYEESLRLEMMMMGMQNKSPSKLIEGADE